MLKKSIKLFILSVFRKFGYAVYKIKNELPVDFEQRHIDIIKRIGVSQLTSHERNYTLIESVRYIVRNNIKGALVECGVYKGGSMMVIAMALMAEGITDRDLYLFDTFEGMPAPEVVDVDIWGKPAMDYFSKLKISEVSSNFINCPLEDVKKAMASTGYPMERIYFVKGLVEDTIPGKAPENIALLRLDTDWYRSTKHELIHLYPRLSIKGIAIIDDYGHYKGARKAVDEYFQNRKTAPLLNRIDYTGRLIIKDE